MNKPTTIAIDLAKDSFQVCKLVGNNIAMERVITKGFCRTLITKRLCHYVNYRGILTELI
ncbi:hypothetical protein [Vibrio breoganii]|uniref:hypothetical protein n=1 Tax=Vibrio breoganii TaxID=553239 RepID=UPI0021C265DB|nr:hypothetical protein [Vibrio breoganii]MDN3714454.1 hypothetical protein [Vibrio breoganii]